MSNETENVRSDPADRGGTTQPGFAGNTDALGQRQGGKTNPDVAGRLAETGNAKATGGGLQPGSTDFGPSTAATQGGRGAAGSDSSRTGGGGTQAGPIEQGESPVIGAGGNSVTATGRPLENDARRGAGSAAVSGTNLTSQQESGHLQPGGTTRSAADPSGVGTRGGGTAGTGAVGNDRAVDIVEGRVAGPEGNVAGRNVAPGEEAPLEADDTNTGASRDSLDRARQQSSPDSRPT